MQELIVASPFDKLKFKFKQESKLPKTLSINEVKQLLNCFNIDFSTLSPFKKIQYIRDAALIDLLVSTGIRIAEASAITFDDIILHQHTILIHGKGRKQRLIYISSPITWGRITTLLKYQKSLKTTKHLFTNRYNQQISTQSIENIYANLLHITLDILLPLTYYLMVQICVQFKKYLGMPVLQQHKYILK